jgi:membrane protein DedA with SNARE-associated domain
MVAVDIDWILVMIYLAVGTAVGALIGFIHGMKKGKKKFYKYPSAHWKIRGK